MHLVSSLIVFLISASCPHSRYAGTETDQLERELVEILLGKEESVRPVNNVHHKRIINGDDVKSSWPWLVSLQNERDVVNGIPQSVHQVCGASLINSRWLLTAAHCFTGEDYTYEKFNIAGPDGFKDYMRARLGDKDFEADAEESVKNFVAQLLLQLIDKLGSEDVTDEDIAELADWVDWTVRFDKVIVHPDYQHGPEHFYRNDIALVKLAAEVPSAPDVVSRIQTVALPEQTDDESWPPEGSTCVFKGWGCTKVGGKSGGSLRRANLTVLTKQYCEDTMAFFAQGFTRGNRICVGTNLDQDKFAGKTTVEEVMEELKLQGEGFSGGCPGDSGGPLMCERDGEWVQAGVASFISTYSTAVPTMFTRVSKYRDWIDETIANN